ncbi:hypothetical protein KSS87_001009 [Heliosperma pusillum]|nr:hypothetical protein KSS87_001009 [Heliosperma pusillum]
MAAKFTTALFLFALLVFSTVLVHAARPVPVSLNPGHQETEQLKVEEVESCKGLNEEECLMRRTLVAHTDYIYTQQQNP